MRSPDVLALVASGLSDAESGDRLYLEEGTVKSHVRHIQTKMGWVEAALVL